MGVSRHCKPAAAWAWFGGELAQVVKTTFRHRQRGAWRSAITGPVNERCWAYWTDPITSNGDAPNDRASSACNAFAPIGHASSVAIAHQ